jgi:AraC-like DNA-binding protein
MEGWSILGLLAAAQGVFLSLVLWFRKAGNVRANALLAGFLFCFSLWLAEFAAYWSPFFLRNPQFSFLTNSLPFLFGPLIWLHGRALSGSFRLRIRHLFHGIPFLLAVADMMPFYMLSPADKLQALQQIIYTDTPSFEARFFIVKLLLVVHISTYLISSWREPGYRHVQLRNWMKRLIGALFLYTIFTVFHFGQILLFGYEFIREVDMVLVIFFAAVIYFISYTYLQRPVQEKNSRPQRAKSTLSGLNVSKKTLAARIVEVVEKQGLYLQSDLKLNDLADECNMTTHQVSEILNDVLGMNFYQFINKFRIREARKLLTDHGYDHRTILSIALEVGFNNKTTFNQAFKSITGKTPSAYRKSRKTENTPADGLT